MNKININDLAILGGKPHFSKELTVGKPNIAQNDEFMSFVCKIIQTGQLTNGGPYIQQFEAEVANYLGVKHFIAVNNATIGLQVAAKALNLSGEVIVPAFTFVATAQAMQWIGLRVVFCDIDLKTMTLDTTHLKNLITSETSAIIPVHIFGRVSNIEEIETIAKENKLKVVFDAAHAFGCRYNSKMIGGYGNCEVFSFHATKVLNCFEGGGISTNDDALAKKIRSLINFGFITYDQTEEFGTNAKMPEICAAHGLLSLQTLSYVISHNRKITQIYDEHLSKISGTHLLRGTMRDDDCNCHYVALSWNPLVLSVSRDTVLNILLKEGCRARRYFYPGVHQLAPFQKLNPKGRCQVPNTEDLCQRVFCLPNGLHVTENDAKEIAQLIVFICENSVELKQFLN